MLCQFLRSGSVTYRLQCGWSLCFLGLSSRIRKEIFVFFCRRGKTGLENIEHEVRISLITTGLDLYNPGINATGMTKPLTIKRPATASFPEQVVIGVLVAGPVAGLWYCQRTGQELHLSNPWLNLALYVAVFCVPLLWAFLMFHRRLEFEETEEITLGYSSAWEKWPIAWWNMFLMWAALVFGVAVWLHDFFSRCLRHPETITMTPGHALVVMVVVFCLGGFYVTMLLGRSENEARLSPEGLRMSIMRFHPWSNLHHVSRHGDLYAIYHQVNPALPAGVLKVRNEEIRALLEKALNEHHVPLSNAVDPQLMGVKMAVAGGFVALLVGAFWLRWHTGLSSLGITLFTFGAGIVLTLFLERVRGVSKYGKYKPNIEPPPVDEMFIRG